MHLRYLGPLEDGFGVQSFGLARVVLVGLDPADVLTAPEAPLPQALRHMTNEQVHPHDQSLRGHNRVTAS